ncbi:HNH endonuclease [Pseudomonas sp. VB3]|uniref:HNH endonuclease n=1 Tax=Pseudomonas sp. VB3 TaxID=2994641 RepID=UPI0022EC512B|nr:HNH endonuclease signature motif containing protein [Pseudomonas sp. VB3]
MKLTKKQRADLREKFDGRCAYCGCDLPERWHADHVEPVVRELLSRRNPNGTWKLVSGKALKPHLDHVENMNPACPPCNISKGGMSLEGWRAWLSGHIKSLNSYHPIYRIAKAYGLIQETGAEVVFHFERIASQEDAA